jgi:CRISPR-associated protein Csm4
LPGKKVTTCSDYIAAKLNKKISWLTPGEFAEIINGQESVLSEKITETSSVTIKNQINRLSGTTGGKETDAATGRLFNFPQRHLEKISIYLKVADDFVETTKDLFDNLSKSGYGKRKTVGYGQFVVKSFDEFTGFGPPKNTNAFMSLSNFVPAVNDPIKGYWGILVKYGKLGEEFAITGNPYKKPLVMFKAGSCFYDNPVRNYYGRLVRDLSSSFPAVVQYGYALPVPMYLDEV